MSEVTRRVEDPARGPARGQARRMRMVRRPEVLEHFAARVAQVLDEETPVLCRAARRAIAVRLVRALELELRRGGRPVRGMTKAEFLHRLERSQNRLLTERERVRQEVAGLRGRLRELDAEPEAVAGLEARVRRALAESGLDRRATTALGAELLRFTLNTVRSELRRSGSGDAGEAVQLQRRVAKLTAEMAQMEEALVKLARMKNVDLGEASIYRTVQGLSGFDALYQQKLEMLEDLFRANRALRDELELG